MGVIHARCINVIGGGSLISPEAVFFRRPVERQWMSVALGVGSSEKSSGPGVSSKLAIKASKGNFMTKEVTETHSMSFFVAAIRRVSRAANRVRPQQ